jgi:hypothetical protein
MPATATTPATTYKEWVVSASFKLDCKLIEVAESNDASLSSSERLHAAHFHDRDSHQLAPMSEYLSQHQIPVASRAYWYVAEYRSLANPQVTTTKGITITLDRLQQREQFVRERQVAGEAGGVATVEYVADFKKMFNVFQWTGMPNPRCKFKVTIAQEQDKFNKKQVGGSTDVWQQWGIFDQLTYGEILTTNYRIPFHVYAKSWPRKITEHPPNKMLKDGVDPEFPDTQGYYYYGIEILVPDYLRYFRGPHGVMVSVDFIKNEFAPWKSIKSGNRIAYELKMRDATVPNPVNDLGLQSAVVSIGNGQSIKVNPDNDTEREDAKFHAVQGDISPLLTGAHDFYVLCSKPMTPDEINKYCTAGPNRAFADEFIATAKREAAAVGKHAYYWLFAVNKSARTVQLQRPVVALPDDADDNDEDKESDESNPKRARANDSGDDNDE